nr:hypothetical protein [Candidatus Saccharibacteria bacterium]
MSSMVDANYNAKEAANTKSGNSWMICSIVLLVILIIGGAFAAMIITKGSRDTNRLADVEQQLKEKEEKISQLEKADGDEQEEMSDRLTRIDIEGLKKVAGISSDEDVYLTINKLEFTNDGKYLYAIGGVGASGTGGAGVWYKSTTSDAEWQTIVKGAQAVGDCSNYSKEVLDFMKDYSYIDDDLPSGYLACRQADGSIFPE